MVEQPRVGQDAIRNGCTLGAPFSSLDYIQRIPVYARVSRRTPVEDVVSLVFVLEIWVM